MDNQPVIQAQPRTPWQITRDVWHALFMREISARITQDRFGWTWLIIEPVLMLVVMIGIRELLGRMRMVVNAEFIPWLLVGILTFFVFRSTLIRGMGAINASSGLFSYRQVQPVDTVLVRGFVELALYTIVFAIFAAFFNFIDIRIIPFSMVDVIYFWFAMWLLGLGFGLILGVATSLVPEVTKLVGVLMMPMYILSGVMIPLTLLPDWLVPYLLLSPVPHLLEGMRAAFFEFYHVMPGIDFMYGIYWVFGTLIVGLMLQLVMKDRVKAQ